MFDSQAGGPDAATTLSLVGQACRQVLEQECALVELAAHWADLNHPDSQPPLAKPLPGAEQGRQLGGQGTPEVLEFAAAELGARMGTTVGSARALLADALDLRHRLPELWQLILSGRVASWRARKVAQATRHLSRDAAMGVDAAVAPSIVGLPWGRFEALLTAKIIEADPKAAEEQAKIWEAERFVRAGRTSQSGLKLLIAKANAGDVIWFMATVNRIAEILQLQGDMDSADVRRSKAIGILAQPALALQLLWEFRNEQRPAAEPQQPDEPIDNEPSPPFESSTAPPPAEPLEAASDKLPRTEPPAGVARVGVDHPAVRGRCWQAAAQGDAAYPSQPRGATRCHRGRDGIRGRSRSSRRSRTSHSRTRTPVPRRYRDATYGCNQSSTHRTPRPWTAMRFRGESAKPCSYACRPAASPTPPAATGWTSTTPSPTSRPPAADHPAKPAFTTSAR